MAGGMAGTPERVVLDGRDWWLYPMRVVDLVDIVAFVRAGMIRAARGAAGTAPAAIAAATRAASGAALSFHVGSPLLETALRDPLLVARLVWAATRPASGSNAPGTRADANPVPFAAFAEVLAADAAGLVAAFERLVAVTPFLAARGGGAPVPSPE